MTDDDRYDDDPTLDRVGRLLRAAGPPPELPADLRARLLEIPRREPHPGADARSGWQRVWWSLQAWRAASGALAVAAVVLAVVVITGGTSGVSIDGRNVALAAGPGYRSSGDVVSVVSNGTRHIRIRIDNLPRLTGDGYYELWIARDPAHRVAIGVYRPTGGQIDTTIAIPNLGPQWQGIWLTHEERPGSPGWSRDWVVAGRMA